MTKRFNFHQGLFLSIVIITIISGSWFTIYIGQYVDQIKRRELQQLVRIAAAGINEQRIKTFTGTSVDLTNPDWLSIRHRLIRILQNDSTLRWVYLINRRDSVIYFYMDTPEPGNAVPGEIYDDAPSELKDVFTDLQPATAGPYNDRWGTFISAFHPIVDPDNHQLLAVVGFDIHAEEWNRMITRQQAGPALLTILILLLEGFLFFYFRRRIHHEHKLQTAYDQLEIMVNKRTTDLVCSNAKLENEIQERLKTETSLKQTSEELDRFFSVTLDLLCITDMRGHFRRLNAEWENTLGYPIKEMENTKFLDYVHPDDIPQTLDALSELTLQKKVINFVNRLRCKSGDYRWIEWRSFPYGDKIYASARDITERKQNEIMLENREKKLRGVFRASPVAIGVLLNRVFVEVNDRMCEMTGFSHSELIGSSARIVYPDQESFEKVGKEKYRQITEKGIGTVETTWTTKNSRNINVLLSSTLIDPLNPDSGTVFTAFDITERKAAEDALKVSENKFRNLTEETGDWIWEMNIEGRFIYSNPKASLLTGYTMDEIIGHSPFEWMDEKDALYFKDLFFSSLSRDNFLNRLETRMKTKTGNYIFLEISNHPVVDERGQVKGIRGISRDVTERRQAEYELREIKNRLEYILGATKTGIDVIDQNFILRYVDPEWKNKYGEFEGKKCFAYFRDRHEPCPECGIPRAFETKQMTITEEILPHENNRIIEVHTIPFQNPEGEWLVAEFNIDISEHKRIEQALKDSQARYRAVMEQATEGIFLFDVESKRIIETNQSYRSMVGYTAEEISSLTAYDLIMHDRTSIDNYIEYICAHQSLIIGHRQHRHKFGYPVDVDVSAHVIDIRLNKVVCVVVRDIRERIKNERTVQALLNRQELILQSLPVVFYTANPHDDMQTLWISEQVDTITGYKPHDFINDHFFWEKHLHEDDRVGMSERYLSILTENELNLEYRWLCADGQYHWFQDQMMLVRDKDGKPLEIVGFWLDITQRKIAEEEKRSLEAQLQHTQKLESLGVLAGGIAHDFNNLLTSVLGYADLSVKKSPKDSPIRDYLTEIEQAALRASDLCRQMLAYSGKGKFIVQPSDLPAIVKEMAGIIKVSLSKKVILQFQFDPNTPPIDADQSQIRQIILNLIINASEAIGNTEGVITVKTGTLFCDKNFFETTWLHDPLPDGNYVYLDISDTGCGMNPDTLAKIFDPFFSTKFSGRGLGLAAVLGIVRGHKGALKVISAPGIGTAFTVYFPASSNTIKEHTKPALSVTPANHGQGVVLIVDDEEPIRRLAKEILELNGFEVVPAGDGNEAINLFRSDPSRFDCVILDMTMPGMDGKETMQALTKIRPDIPVIMSSGYSEYEIAKYFSEEPLAGFVQKPYDIDSLCRLLKKAIAASHK